MSDDLFWRYPLPFWLRDCALGDPPLIEETEWRIATQRQVPFKFQELCDGVLMSVLLRFIDPSTEIFIDQNVDNERDSAFKQKQLRVFFNAISRFYKVRMQQIIVLSTPDFSLIARSVSPDESIEEVNKLILLLLGCAIQSDKKRDFVDRITKFDRNIQIGLASYIQQLTEGDSVVISSIRSEIVFRHLDQVMKDRDMQVEISSIDHDSDEGSSITTSSSLNGEIKHYDRSTSPNSFQRQSAIELAHVKQEMRRLRKAAEDRDEENQNLMKDLESKMSKITHLENERLELLKKARQVRNLQDDIQVAQHEIERLKSLEGVDKQLRETKDQNELLQMKYEQVESKCKTLEDTIEELDRKIENLQIENMRLNDVVKEFERSKTCFRDLESEIEKKNSEINELNEEKYRMERELKEREERISQLESNSPSFTPRHIGSLADQLDDAEKEEMDRLRAENRKLRAQTEGAVPENFELDKLRSKLAAQEVLLAETRLESQKMKVEREQIDGTLDRVSIELEQATIKVEDMRAERDEAIRGLHEARRKFAQFQTEFGKKIEEKTEFKIRDLEFELKESRRKLNQAEEDRLESDHHLERLRDEQRKLRFEVDEMSEEKSQMVSALAHAERARKNAETERNALREKNEKIEDELEELRLRLLNVDNSAKRLEDREKLIVEQQNRLGDLESENKTVQRQLEFELKKTQRLREDLVMEKSKGAELIGRLRSLCAAVAMNGGKMDTSEMGDTELVSTIDDIIMNALSNAKRESDALRLQQHQQIAELADLKTDIEKLRRTERVSLLESDDRVRELNQENVNMKEQVFILQEKIRELNVEISAKQNEIQLARSNIEELNRNATATSVNNTEVARLQVSLRNAQLQEELVKQENTELRKQLDFAEKNAAKTKTDLNVLESMHKALLSDHSRLQQLHNLLSRDYEDTKNESSEMRAKLRAHQHSSPVTSHHSRELEELRTQLALEKSARDKQLRAYADLQNEHGLVRRQVDHLRTENENLARNRDTLSQELRKNRNNDITKRYNGLLEDLNRQLQSKELEIAKMNHKIDALTQLNQTYNEENRNLSRQLEILLAQNKELLNRALNDKDQYHSEMKDFQEQLTALRRHKEKLEDKIMDQYRTMENKKTQERKQPLVKRAAKALISRRRASSQGGSTTEDSSAYSADEGASPPLGNNKLKPEISAPIALLSSIPESCPLHGKLRDITPQFAEEARMKSLSLRLPTMRRRAPLFRDDTNRGAYNNPNVREVHDNLLATCSSSEDHDCNSLRYESINVPREILQTFSSPLRQRGDPIGGSVRLPSTHIPRILHSQTYDNFKDLPEKQLKSLPPRAPIRNSSATSSLRLRPPPPPYPSKNHNQSLPVYSIHNCDTSTSPPLFQPRSASTPKPDDSLTLMNDSILDRSVVPEGEKRSFVREKDERTDKALSYYENVQGPSTSNSEGKVNESTVWYEYGCV
ncbi:unnamed protein product [Caenorhabditis bovis]|uniref:HOOK N-terminal domain-containing protein n=1 Tax=Caenorhabditis bovis TaxID=2654633 RepID=A0A8S1EB76_9PELO|nr:unnamed protein product [Caenorhabditis bovis]